ncbi:MAG TPA: Holliday junction resolvase-like protein [Candidatus Thermoplasmatota archaeon]|nr:Holliday junction resolvase-like protein [Candidatus Thermoplasmatota archaeon]
MDPLLTAALALAGALALALLVTVPWLRRLRRQLRTLESEKRSQSTRYGQITEQFAPFLESWPWDPKGFRFLGNPVDGVQFTPDGIYFVEVKSASSRLSSGQREVRDLVEAGRVEWREVRIG